MNISFYLRIKRRRGHNIAIVATARKMLVCIYYMLKRKCTTKVRFINPDQIP